MWAEEDTLLTINNPCVRVWNVKTERSDLQYDSEESEDITGSLMKLSELSLHDFLADEPDVYTVDDLKVRYY